MGTDNPSPGPSSGLPQQPGNERLARRGKDGLSGSPRWVWLMALVVFPAIVGLHAWRTLDTLREQRELYLRDRVARLAARLEALPSREQTGLPLPAASFDTLFEEEPALLNAQLGRPGDGDDAVTAILAGREIFRMQALRDDGPPILRAWVPFHHSGQLQVAVLDFDATAADFFNRYAYQSILLVTLIAAALIGLSVYAFRLAGRRALLERRHAELQHLAQLGEMSAVLAHEIRNPLGSIKGFAQLLAEEVPVELRGHATEIVGQSGRLERLVNDLLHYGRTPEPVFQPVLWAELAGVLRRRHSSDETSGRVHVSIGDADLNLYTDPLLLEQILANLLRNAREACQAVLADQASPDTEVRAMEVTVSARAAGPTALITVADTGPGLSTAARERLFEPFFTTKSFGTGLGLAITRKMTAALNGELTIDSPATGGVVATLRLPLVSGESGGN